MPLIVGKHIEKKPEVEDKPVPPPPVEYKWNTEERRMVRVKEPIETAPAVPVVEITSTYHHQVDGDLHKLINKKSEYLKDMLDFESNK